MGPEPDQVAWPDNYFNYFTEVEEHFQKARGTGLFLLSPLDWALIETWKNAGLPLQAVLRGIDAAFEKWRSRKKRIESVNSLAYCSQAVLAEAQLLAGVTQQRGTGPGKTVEAPFTLEEMRQHIDLNLAVVAAVQGCEEIAAGLRRIAGESEALYSDLEQMEQRLTALEEKMIAIARLRQNEEEAFQARRQLELELRSYRGKMSAEQIAMLEKQYLERRLLETAGLPRLSLFYLR